MTKAITRWVPVLSILWILVLSMPGATPPVPADRGMESAEDVDLFDYVRAERRGALDPLG